MKKRKVVISSLFLISILFIGFKLSLNAQENIEVSKDTQAEINKNRAAGIFDLPDDKLEQNLMDDARYTGALGTMPEEKLLNISEINLDDKITSLEGMDYYINKGLLTNVWFFYSGSYYIKDFSPVMNLNNVEEFYIVYNPHITNLDCFAKTSFPKLEELYLINTNVTDISGLSTAYMPYIRSLDFKDNKIKSLKGIENLNIETLYVENNELEELTDFSKMTNLYQVSASGNGLTNLDGVQNSNIKNLNVVDNNITDISAVYNVPNLTALALEDNNVEDISVLEEIPSIQFLYLNDNNVSDLSPLEKNKSNYMELELENQHLSIDLGDFDDVSEIPNDVTLYLVDGTEIEVPYGLDVNDINDYKDYSYSTTFSHTGANYTYSGDLTVNFTYSKAAPKPLTPLDPSTPITPLTPVDPSNPITNDSGDIEDPDIPSGIIDSEKKDVVKSNKEVDNIVKKLIQTGKDNILLIIYIIILAISLRVLILIKKV